MNDELLKQLIAGGEKAINGLLSTMTLEVECSEEERQELANITRERSDPVHTWVVTRNKPLGEIESE